jgi:hypothetical protein
MFSYRDLSIWKKFMKVLILSVTQNLSGLHHLLLLAEQATKSHHFTNLLLMTHFLQEMLI